jgi:hypothetical protein
MCKADFKKVRRPPQLPHRRHEEDFGLFALARGNFRSDKRAKCFPPYSFTLWLLSLPGSS